MSTIVLKNGNIMVKEIKREKEDDVNKLGLYIPESMLEDEQVSQGKVVASNINDYELGDILLFHKVMPVDVNIKMDWDEGLERYFFIKENDVICKIMQ